MLDQVTFHSKLDFTVRYKKVLTALMGLRTQPEDDRCVTSNLTVACELCVTAHMSEV